MNIQNIVNFMQQVRDPQQMLRKMGIPEEHMNNPQSAAQFLLDNGKVNQQQIQQAQSLYQQIFRR